MKHLVRILAVLFLLANASAQFVAFKASQGISAAKSLAKDDSMPNATITSVATLGDTTFFGAYLPAEAKSLLQFNFDPNKGTSTFWGYRMHDVVHNQDSTIAAAVIDVLTLFRAIATSLPAIPNIPVRLDLALPASYMDSDTMALRIRTNSVYTNYLSSHKTAKFQAIVLGQSKGGIYPEGPLWLAIIGDKPTNQSLQCYVTASSGSTAAAVCELMEGVGVNDETADASGFSVYPNPVTMGRVRIHTPLDHYTGQLSVDIVSTLGQPLQHYSFERLGGGVDAELDVRSLPEGSYLLRIATTQTQQVLPLIVAP